MDENIKRIVFVDLDGVLANFALGFHNLTGLNSETTPDEELWPKIEEYGKTKFFSELPWMKDGKELWSFITNNFLNVKILSALGKNDKVDGGKTRVGKLQWLAHNIPQLQRNDIQFVYNKRQKKDHCKSPNDILIDDTKIVIDDWNKQGGIGILHHSTQDTISKLTLYL